MDDLDGVFSRYKEKYPAVGFVKRPSNRPFASYSSHDPEGHLFDLTQPGMDNIRGVWGESARHQERYIKHLTIRALNAAALARFYVDVFEFKEEKAIELPNFYLTDGAVTLVLTPWKIEDYENAEHRGPGLDHVGFKVGGLNIFQNDFQILTNTDPEWMVPKAPNLASEHDVVLRLLSACRYGQNQLADPDGNFIDVTDR